ncbi:MAG: DUF2752 domain-containing protein [Leptonema sp. (in: Bacteria)]|nr:DUF2752 domain-containing protein [Leptonema sp. (in: bacteria)]
MKLRDLRILLVGYLILSLFPISGFSFCVFYNVSGYPCPGCGMTRAIHSLLFDHDIGFALKYHPVSLVLAPMLVIAAMSFLLPNSKLEYFYNLHIKKINIVVGAIVIVIFAYGFIRILYLVSGWPDIGSWFAGFQDQTLIELIDSRFFH